MQPAHPVRFNHEYFGFIVGFDDGHIGLYNHDAATTLARDNISAVDLDDHLLEQLTVRNNFHLHTPLLVWIELTRRCNLTCPHCYIDAGPARPDEMTTNEVLRLIDDLADIGVWAVTFTGGEPTMHTDFVDFVRHARQRGLLVGIATNGTYLTETLLNQLPRDGVIISVSYDNLHIRNKREPRADFTVTSRAVSRSRRLGFETNIMTNIHKHNVTELDETLSWAKELGVSIRSVPFTPTGRGHEHPEWENTPEDVGILAQYWLAEKEWEERFHHKVGLCVGNIFDYGETLAYLTRRCPSGRYLCYVAADGTVYPCTTCAAEQILSPGNLREHDSFAALWRSDWEIRHYSWENFTSTCQGCPINNPDYYCSSRCPAFSYARHRELFSCGASDFQIHSTIVRTAMLRHSTLGDSEQAISTVKRHGGTST